MIWINDPGTRRLHIFKIIAGATLLTGTLDISDALIFYGLRGATPLRVLQSISAASIWGRSAYSRGVPAAVTGLAVHIAIACIVATCYLLASRYLPLAVHPLLYGTAYGIVVYCVMNFVVMPLSRTPPKLLIAPPVPLINGVAALIVCIGIPLGFIARRYVSLHSEGAQAYAAK